MPNENNFLEKSLLVQVETTKVRRILNFENSFEEFKELARSAGANVLGEIKGKQELASPRYFIQKGKLEEIKQEVHKNKIVWLFLIMLYRHHKKEISSVI